MGSCDESVDVILKSLTVLRDDGDYTEISYGGEFYPVIDDGGMKFAVLPSGMVLYKALPKHSSLVDYFKGKKYPYPSFYTDFDVAVDYMRSYYPNGDGVVMKFLVVRPVKMFVLNDVNNLIELAKLFSQTPGVRGLLNDSRREAVRELMMVTGMGVRCLEQEKFRDEVERSLDVVYDDYRLNEDICEVIVDESVKRMSLYAIDLQFSQNLCLVLKQFGNDGYVAREMLTAFGETAPIFHREMMFCFTSEVIEEVGVVEVDGDGIGQIDVESVSY